MATALAGPIIVFFHHPFDSHLPRRSKYTGSNPVEAMRGGVSPFKRPWGFKERSCIFIWPGAMSGRNPKRTGIILVAVIIGAWSMLAFSAPLPGDDGIHPGQRAEPR